ncbi:MAG TPA: hypothetical protein VHS31_14950, partial [Tepidisphaeraceae bacterium]|nr:hypothetical protein [Tepidisphaeraceae bacterium]
MIDRKHVRRAWEVGWPYLLLGLLCVGFFWDSLFAGKALILRDVWAGWLSERALQKRMIWSGHFPIWNPFEAWGQLSLGNSATGTLYPLHLIFDLLPLVTALKLSQVLHTFIAMAGMYRLLKSWGCGAAAALIGGICSAMGTCPIAYMEWPYAMAVLAWTPWTMLFAGELANKAACGFANQAGEITQSPKPQGAKWIINLKSTFPSLAKLTIVMAIQFLGGHPDVWYLCTLILLLYALIEFPHRHGWAAAVRAWQGLALAALLAAAITSPEWLMLAQRVGLSDREANVDPLMSDASVHPAHWVTLMLPYLFGRPGYPHKFWGITLFEFWVGTAYVGILPLVLAVAALIGGWKGIDRLRRARMIFIAVTMALGVTLASGQYTPIFQIAHAHLPGFTKMRWPAKTLILVHYSLSMLAALGVQQLLNWRGKRETRQHAIFGWIALGSVGLAALAIVVSLLANQESLFHHLTLAQAQPNAERLADFHGQLIGALLACIGGCIAIAAIAIRIIPARVGAGVMIAVCYFDLFHISRQVHPILPNDVYHFPDSMVQKTMPGSSPLDRIYSNYCVIEQFLYADGKPGDWEACKPMVVGDSWLYYDIGNIWGSGLMLERYSDLIGTMLTTDSNTANRLADIMSMTYLIGWQPRPQTWDQQPVTIARIFKRPTAMPRASIVRNWIIPSDSKYGERMLLSPEFDLSFNAVLEADEKGNAPPLPNQETRATHIEVHSIHYNWERCDIDLDTNGQSLLVLNDTFYPGWVAEVDGVPTTIYRANLVFRGVLLK